MDVIFRDINVSIGSLPILQQVSGMAMQGHMLAVMGPSGAGKSTLLNALAGRLPTQSGTITLNGQSLTRKLRRKICYVLQTDVFFPNLTLKETLTYTALLRLPDAMPQEMKKQRVEDVITALELERCQDTVMGGLFLAGLSGGERKRASIGAELLTNPSMIMLDELTSGLDSAIAYNIMRIMKHYSEVSNKTVITSIHQPSSQIFHMFDNILLLANGQVAYFGQVSKILDFFSRIEMPCTPNYNPADFILEKISEGEKIVAKIVKAADDRRLTSEWPEELKSDSQLTSEDDPLEVKVIDMVLDEQQGLLANGTSPNGRVKTSSATDMAELTDVAVTDKTDKATSTSHRSHKFTSDSHNIDSYYRESCKWQTSFLTQYSVLTSRNFRQARGRILSKLNLIQNFVLALFSGVLWFQTPRTEETMKDRMGIIFFMIVYFGFIPLYDILTSFPEERPVLMKERSAGAYRLSAYYCAKMTSECPLMFIMPLCFLTIVYWMSGLTVAAGNFISMCCLILLHSLLSQSIGLLIGVSVMDFKTAITSGAVFMLSSLLAGGYYQTHFPAWLSWAKYLSIINYTYQAFLHVEFLWGPPIQCNPPGSSKFELCNQNLTTEVSGAEVLETVGVDLSLHVCVLVIFGLMVIIRTAGYLVLRYLRRPAGN